MCPSTQHHLISSQSTHFNVSQFASKIEVSISPLRILVIPNFLPCHGFQMSDLISQHILYQN